MFINFFELFWSFFFEGTVVKYQLVIRIRNSALISSDPVDRSCNWWEIRINGGILQGIIDFLPMLQETCFHFIQVRLILPKKNLMLLFKLSMYDRSFQKPLEVV